MMPVIYEKLNNLKFWYFWLLWHGHTELILEYLALYCLSSKVKIILSLKFSISISISKKHTVLIIVVIIGVDTRFVK